MCTLQLQSISAVIWHNVRRKLHTKPHSCKEEENVLQSCTSTRKSSDFSEQKDSFKQLHAVTRVKYL